MLKQIIEYYDNIFTDDEIDILLKVNCNYR
jgi:hypothetical protein